MAAHRWALMLVSALGAAIVAPGPAVSQDKDPIALFNEASDLAEKGELGGAVAIWLMVAEDIPDKYKPVIQVNLGLAYKELGKLPEAWHHLSLYQKTVAKPDAEADVWKKEIEAQLVNTHVKMTVACEPDGATVNLQSSDGAAIPYRCPLTFWFKKGKVPIRVDKEGFDKKIELLDVTDARSGSVHLVKLESNVKTGTLEVKGDARAAQVFIDGRLEGGVPFSRTLSPGSYELMVGGPGKPPWNKTIVIEAGKTITESPAVARKPVEEPVPDKVEPKPEITGKPGGGPGIAPWKWAVVGGGAALLVGGATIHVLAMGKNQDLRDQYPDGTAEKPQPADNREKYSAAFDDEVAPMLYGAYGLYGLGGAAAIAGTVLMFVGPKGGESRTSFAPLLAPGTMGMSFEVGF